MFSATSAPLGDPALVRRMKREQANANSKDNRRVFGPYKNWGYQNKRIEFQHQSMPPP